MSTHEDAKESLAIGVDIGGTKIAAGVVDQEGKIVASTRRDTPAEDPSKTLDAIADAIRELTSKHVCVRVGLGAAGFVDEKRSTVMFAPNLAWRDEHLRTSLERMLELAVVVENDANAAAWAEARFGAARGESHAVVLTVGWTAAVTVGAVLGANDALTEVLAIALPLCLVAIVAPHLRVPGGVAAVAGAAVVTLATRTWPAGSGMLLAIAAAAMCGALTAGRSS